jgi:LDH2 family malate/lactate/ureidoglycolate dehydrogenase
MTPADTFLISPSALRGWVGRAFERAGLPTADAASAADVLVSANLRGVDSHGVLQLAVKVRRVLAGAMNPRPNIRLERDSPAALLVDGDNGVGMVVGAWAMRQVIRRARETGAAFAAVRVHGPLGERHTVPEHQPAGDRRAGRPGGRDRAGHGDQPGGLG